MKRLISMMVIFVLMLPCVSFAENTSWDGSVDEAWGENYSESDSFSISTPAEFIKFRNMVLTGNNFKGKTVRLNDDLDMGNLNLKYGVGRMSGIQFTAGTDIFYFAGTFDGNGHIIRNISMNPNQNDTNAPQDIESNNYAIAVFGAMSSSGFIQNLGVENISITLHDATPAAGLYAGLAAVSSFSKITSSYVKNISFHGGWSGSSTPVYSSAAGITAWGPGFSVSNIYVSGADFSGINPTNLRKSGITSIERSESCSVANGYTELIKYGDNPYRFDSTVYVHTKTTNCSIQNIYAEEPLRIVDGVEQSITGANNSTAEMMEEASPLGAGFRDLSFMKLLPVLSWQPEISAFEYDSFELYKDYNKNTEILLSDKTTEKGEISAVIKGLKNNTGFDLEAVAAIVYIDGGSMKGYYPCKVTISPRAKLSEAIVVTIDIPEQATDDKSFIQAMVYMGTENVSPLFAARKVVVE